MRLLPSIGFQVKPPCDCCCPCIEVDACSLFFLLRRLYTLLSYQADSFHLISYLIVTKRGKHGKEEERIHLARVVLLV